MSKVLWVAALIGLAAWPVAAQQQAAPDSAAGDHAGHDQAGHNHARAESRGANKEESNVDYFWRKSDQAFHDGDYERAINLHRAIVALAPDDVESFGVAAWLMWSMGHKDEATAHIERGLKANPNNWDMWNEAAQHYDLQKMPAQALAAYRRAVELMPADADSQMTRRRLAHAAERGGDLPLSLQTWRDLARDFPTEVVNKNNLARVEKLQAPAG